MDRSLSSQTGGATEISHPSRASLICPARPWAAGSSASACCSNRTRPASGLRSMGQLQAPGMGQPGGSTVWLASEVAGSQRLQGCDKIASARAPAPRRLPPCTSMMMAARAKTSSVPGPSVGAGVFVIYRSGALAPSRRGRCRFRSGNGSLVSSPATC